MKRYSICTKKEIEGREKPLWRTVGTLTEFPPNDRNPDGGFALELFHQPETKFYVFPQRERQNASQEDDLPV